MRKCNPDAPWPALAFAGPHPDLFLPNRRLIMRWTGLLLSVAILGISTALFLSFAPDNGHSLTIRSTDFGLEQMKAV